MCLSGVGIGAIGLDVVGGVFKGRLEGSPKRSQIGFRWVGVWSGVHVNGD